MCEFRWHNDSSGVSGNARCVIKFPSKISCVYFLTLLFDIIDRRSVSRGYLIGHTCWKFISAKPTRCVISKQTKWYAVTLIEIILGATAVVSTIFCINGFPTENTPVDYLGYGIWGWEDREYRELQIMNMYLHIPLFKG